jgi:NAD dependent epimerase/dehydratase
VTAASARFAGRRVLVTGAGGFIGSHLVEALLRQGADVTVLLRYTSRGGRGNLDFLSDTDGARLRVVFGDVSDPQTVEEAVAGHEFVFHLAALVGIPYSYEHPREVMDANVVGTVNVLLAAKSSGVHRIVLTSTSEVYGSARSVPMSEEHPLNAQSPYAASKIAADALGLSFHRSFGLPVTIVRPFNAFGPRQSARAVIPTIISQALRGGPLQLGTLETRRDFTFVADTAAGFLDVAAADACVGEVVNLGTGQDVRVGDVVALVGRILGRELQVVTDTERMRPKESEVTRLLADASKARRLAGWQPSVPFETGLRATVEWVAANPALFRPDEYAR